MEIPVGSDMVTAARRARQRADRLTYVAEVIGDAAPCRDISGERNELRRAAAHADQRALLLESLVRGRGGRGGARRPTSR
jgi:hypothetical protein